MSWTGGGTPLPSQAANWASPTTRMYHGGGNAVTRQDGKSRMDMLDWQAEACSRSSAPDRVIRSGPSSSALRLAFYLRTRATTSSELRSEMRFLLRLGLKATGGKRWTRISAAPFVRPSFRRRLNPRFVEYLMGWPIGWTSSAKVETASSLWWQAMRGELSRLVSRPVQATLL